MLTFTISPYSSADLNTKINFTTTHVLPGKTLPKDFPNIADTPITQKWMRPLFDRIIIYTEGCYFMRSFAVDINLDRLDRYADPTQKPIDLGTIRKKLLGNSYSSFSQFIDDIKTMLNNVIEHSNSTDPNHKEALRLSYHICEYLKKIDSNPDISPFDDGKTDRDLTLEVESRIASAIRELQKKKKEFEKGSRSSYETSRYKESQRQSKKITDSELDDLVKSIKQLKSSALIGVVEIIENKPFSETLLPLQINLKHLDERKFDIKKLKTYVDYCKEGNGQHYYAWKPCLPNELQELHSKYESKLMDWLRPPWDCPIP